MRAPMLVLVVGAVAGGLALTPFAKSLGSEEHFQFSALGAVAVALGLIGLLCAWLLHGPRREGVADALPAPVLAVVRSGAIDGSYVFVWRYVLRSLARVIGWIDRYVVDGVINVAGYAALLLGSGLRRLQTGLAQDYVVALFVGFLALAAWSLWGT
jgi:NADH-quinone oxidoreductase subunit L